MPQLYQASVQLRCCGEILSKADRLFGFRALGAAERKLFYHAERWVLRGARRDALPSAQLNQWHAGDVAMLAHDPDDALCAQASRVGVLVVAELDKPDLPQIRRLARWPAVAVVVLPTGARVDLDGLAHNILLAARISANFELPLPDWAQIVLYEVTAGSEPSNVIASCPLPVIAAPASATKFTTIGEARAACDQLQRALAPLDLAGYIV